MKFVTIFDPKRDLNFVRLFDKAIWFSIILPLTTLILLFTLGINWGIDFSGGTELQVKFNKTIPPAEIREVLEEAGFSKNQVQQFGAESNNELLIRVQSVAVLKKEDIDRLKSFIQKDFGFSDSEVAIAYDESSSSQATIWLKEPAYANKEDAESYKQDLLTQKSSLTSIIEKSGLKLRASGDNVAEHTTTSAVTQDDPIDGKVKYIVHFEGVSNKINQALAAKFGTIEIRKVDFVDSQMSKQLRTDGVLAVFYSLLAIVIYIAIRFDLFFSPGAILALVTDVFGAMLVFVLGRVEFDAPCVAALLTILGYSINNTIVIYDRIREKVPQHPKKPLSSEEIKPYVNKAINDTLSRTINTTLTTLFASVSIWIFATGVIKVFAMVLTVGITIGAFTSIFISPAAYVLAKKYIKSNENSEDRSNFSREDKAKGVV